jgi:hypothetical protein
LLVGEGVGLPDGELAVEPGLRLGIADGWGLVLGLALTDPRGVGDPPMARPGVSGGLTRARRSAPRAATIRTTRPI